MKNRGINIELERQQRSPEDWVFGSNSKVCIAAIPEADREKFLPPGEVQAAKEDMMDCASRGPVNILETKFTWLFAKNILNESNLKWLAEKGYVEPESTTIQFSDAFIAIKSGTTRNGNSMKAPLQAIHDWGLIPKHMMPLEPWMTFEDYHNKARITPEIEALATEFKSRFPVNYEVVNAKHFKILYNEDMIDLAGFAWPEPVNGVYPAVDMQVNHVFVGVRSPVHTIFDNYTDVVDGDFIKILASDYQLYDYGYRVFISENEIPKVVKKNAFLSFLNSLKSLICRR